jgi:hypothetical protein
MGQKASTRHLNIRAPVRSDPDTGSDFGGIAKAARLLPVRRIEIEVPEDGARPETSVSPGLT